jgi:hypothetical protein
LFLFNGLKTNSGNSHELDFVRERLRRGPDKQPPPSRAAARAALIARRRLRLPLLNIRILMVLLALASPALASPALAQDGARDAAAAREAAQAFRVYVEGVTKKGGRPDLTRPEVAAPLGRIFDLDALNALPPAQASDISWLFDWMETANAINKLLISNGAKPGPQARFGDDPAQHDRI